MLRLILALSLISLLIAQNCPLPNNTDIEGSQALIALLVEEEADGLSHDENLGEEYDPTIIGSIQYVCLAQGNMINTYRTVSVIATFTPNPGESSRTSIFQLMCSNGVWAAYGQLADPDSSIINATTRTDCAQCRHGNGHDRCNCKLIHENNHYIPLLSHVACDAACNTGLMRCTGSSSSDCCLTFTSSGQCSNTLSCSSSGTNFIANADNGYFCSKLILILNIQCLMQK